MRAPDQARGTARVWRMATDRGAKSAPDHEASLAAWLINSPSFNIGWSWWLVSVIHLRPIPGVRPAFKRYPDAEFEIGIVSLNPGYAVDVDAIEEGREFLHFLTPQDLQFQFHGVTDEQAVQLGSDVIRAILAGHSPDSDFRSWWEDALTDTLAHYRLGLHRVGGDA